jgi:trk system potassium uptake protein TrkA
MKVIIIGCGRLGSGLAGHLTRKGHDVTVIDSAPEALAHLGKDFKGKTIVGIGFDKDLIEKAGIRKVDAVIACTNSDEANALIGRISRNIYQVPRVISRLYDPRKAELYRTLGIQTISTTAWGIAQVTEMLSYNQLDSIQSLGSGQVELIRIDVPAMLSGRQIGELAIVGEIQVVALCRQNETTVPTMGTTLKTNDVVYLSVAAASAGRLKSLLGLE